MLKGKCSAGKLYAGVLLLLGCRSLPPGCPLLPSAGITVSPGSVDLCVGQHIQLTAVSGAPWDTKVVWDSSDAAVASVNPFGVVNAVAVGAATITATGSASKKEAAVTVNVRPEDIVGVSPDVTTFPFVNGMDFGHSMDGTTEDDSAASIFPSPLDSDIRTTPSSTGTDFEFVLYESADDFSDDMSVSCKSSLNLGVGKESEEYKASVQISRQVNSVHAAVRWTRTATLLKFANPALLDGMKELYLTDNGTFHERYGDQYLSEIQLGATFVGILSIETTTESEKADVTAKLKTSVGPVKDQATFQNNLSNFASSYGIQVKVLTRCGPDITPGAISTLGDLFDKLADFQKGVDADLDPNGSRYDPARLLQTYSFTAYYEPYTDVAALLPGPDDTIFNFDSSNQSMIALAGLYRDYETVQARAIYMMNNPEFFAEYKPQWLQGFIDSMGQYEQNVIDLAKTYDPTPTETTDTNGNPVYTVWKQNINHLHTSQPGKYPDPATLMGSLPAELDIYCQSCAEMKKVCPSRTQDNEYTVYFGGDRQKPYRVYCHGMGTAAPKDYLTLANQQSDDSSGFNYNYSWSSQYFAVTFFQKLGITPKTDHIEVNKTDFTFSSSISAATEYSTAIANHQFPASANIDLRGTPFYVPASVVWTPANDSAVRSSNNQVVDLSIFSFFGGTTALSTSSLTLQYDNALTAAP